MSIEGLTNRILYEDNHLIIVNKLPSEIVQSDKTGDETLADIVKLYLKEKYNKPGDVFLGIVHRIDRPVSGVVVFARTSKALKRMNELIKRREIEKKYWAIVKNEPPFAEGELIHYLKRDSEKNRSYAFKKPVEYAKEANLFYRIIAKSDEYYLLEINLVTGRHHQIRVQLSKIGCPVKGDLKYGFPRSNKNGSISLHARSIEFEHPVQKTRMRIVGDPPEDPLWNYFLGIFS